MTALRIRLARWLLRGTGHHVRRIPIRWPKMLPPTTEPVKVFSTKLLDASLVYGAP